MNAWKKVAFLVRNRHMKAFRTSFPTLMLFLMIEIAWVVETDAVRSTFFWLRIKRAKAKRVMLFCKLTYTLHLSKTYLGERANYQDWGCYDATVPLVTVA